MIAHNTFIQKAPKSIAIVFILLYFAFQLPSCGNYFSDECDNILEAPQEFLDYWYFPDGSWWVYQINDTIIDTVTISTSIKHFDKDDLTDINGSCVYIYNASFRHSNQLLFPGNSNTHDFYSVYLNNHWLLGSYPRYYWNFDFFFIYPLTVGQTISYQQIGVDTTHTLIKDKNSIEILGEKYDSIIHVYYFDTKNVENRIKKNIWIAKNIGIVKVNYYNDERIELLDYFINK